ncbi:8126_t:CDS:2 [Paraglomus occultum]|uniref:8126_t:CDS:1 n=1 Tax=Paraglomus occultum TaxID=144539 RepID=A0A9N9BDD6_9GLOM|nr:8126_t:CDS:2 [Paraglomus occultum]
MGGCCSLIRRKKNDQQFNSKFKVIDGRRFQQLDDSNYVLPNDSDEDERLDIQHIILKNTFNGNFSAPVDQLLRSGARVLDVGCGSGVWTLDLAKEYPNSHFVGIDITLAGVMGETPSNVEFIEYNVLDGLPFNSNSFDYVFARALISVYTRAQWTELAIPEYVRVTKPGGWVELMELGLPRDGNDINIQRLGNAWISIAESKGLVVETNFEVRGFIEQSGFFTNINHETQHVPIGPKGDKHAELGIRCFRDLWCGLKVPYMAVMQVTGEHYDAIVEAAVHSLIHKGTTWEFTRAWGQKKG